MAHNGNIFKYSAMQNVLTLNSSKEKLSGFIKLKVAQDYSQMSGKSIAMCKVGIIGRGLRKHWTEPKAGHTLKVQIFEILVKMSY